MRTIIKVRDLVKHYGDVKAVDGISFEVSLASWDPTGPGRPPPSK